jgi:hypothetical protein
MCFFRSTLYDCFRKVKQTRYYNLQFTTKCLNQLNTEIRLNDLQNFSSNLTKVYCFSITIFSLFMLFMVVIPVDSKNRMAHSVGELQSILMLIQV